MSYENERPESMSEQVNEAFYETRNQTKRARTLFASYAISAEVHALEELLEGYDQKRGESTLDTSLHCSLSTLGFLGVTFSPNKHQSAAYLLEKDRLQEHAAPGEHGPIKKAALARTAVLDGVQAMYALTDRQARKALKLAKR